MTHIPIAAHLCRNSIKISESVACGVGSQQAFLSEMPEDAIELTPDLVSETITSDIEPSKSSFFTNKQLALLVVGALSTGALAYNATAISNFVFTNATTVNDLFWSSVGSLHEAFDTNFIIENLTLDRAVWQRDSLYPILRTSAYLGAFYVVGKEAMHGALYAMYSAASFVVGSSEDTAAPDWIERAQKSHSKSFFKELYSSLFIVASLVAIGLTIENHESNLNLYIEDKQLKDSIGAKLSKGEFTELYNSFFSEGGPANFSEPVLGDNICRLFDISMKALRKFRINPLKTQHTNILQQYGTGYLKDISGNLRGFINGKMEEGTSLFNDWLNRPSNATSAPFEAPPLAHEVPYKDGKRFTENMCRLYNTTSDFVFSVPNRTASAWNATQLFLSNPVENIQDYFYGRVDEEFKKTNLYWIKSQLETFNLI